MLKRLALVTNQIDIRTGCLRTDQNRSGDTKRVQFHAFPPQQFAERKHIALDRIRAIALQKMPKSLPRLMMSGDPFNTHRM